MADDFFECEICGYEFSEDLINADKDFAIELHKRIHKGEI